MDCSRLKDDMTLPRSIIESKELNPIRRTVVCSTVLLRDGGRFSALNSTNQHRTVPKFIAPDAVLYRYPSALQHWSVFSSFYLIGGSRVDI